MDFLLIYALFALTTSLAAVYELLMPVMSKHPEAPDKVLIHIVFIAVTFLIAPLTFFSCIVPSMGIVFREYLEEGLFPKV